MRTLSELRFSSYKHGQNFFFPKSVAKSALHGLSLIETSPKKHDACRIGLPNRTATKINQAPQTQHEMQDGWLRARGLQVANFGYLWISR